MEENKLQQNADNPSVGYDHDIREAIEYRKF
jgi:hypothetical protein